MVAKPSLFSRVRPGKTSPKKVRGFLALPSELRNQVYNHYFEDDFRCEIVAQGTTFEEKKPRNVKLCLSIIGSRRPTCKYQENQKQGTPITIRIYRRLGKYKRIHGARTSWPNSLCALALVCKQIYEETILFLYLKTTFVFDAPSRITNFMNSIPRNNLVNITKLQLHYTTYGDPICVRDQVWQDKHVAAWRRACHGAAKKLLGLRELDIWLCVSCCLPRFDLRQVWLQPLLEFRRLVCNREARANAGIETTSGSQEQSSKTLRAVRIYLKTEHSDPKAFYDADLADASADLHYLFSQAIAHAILGADEMTAMARYNKAWEGEYNLFQHRLRYSDLN